MRPTWVVHKCILNTVFTDVQDTVHKYCRKSAPRQWHGCQYPECRYWRACTPCGCCQVHVLCCSVDSPYHHMLRCSYNRKSQYLVKVSHSRSYDTMLKAAVAYDMMRQASGRPAVNFPAEVTAAGVPAMKHWIDLDLIRLTVEKQYWRDKAAAATSDNSVQNPWGAASRGRRAQVHQQ